MKKSRLFTAGALALTLALGLVLAGCGDEGTAAKVTVIFNKNGADGNAPAEKTVDKGSRITIPGEGNLYLSGFSFKGWNTRRDGSGDLYYEGDRMAVNDDITLYAQWGQGGNPNPNNPNPNNPDPNNPNPNNPDPNNPDPNNPNPNNPDPGDNNGVPSAPTGVTATRLSTPSEILVSWNEVNGATSYNVYRSSEAFSDYDLDGPSNTTSFTSTGNATSATIYFTVTAVNSAGESAKSRFASVGEASSGGNSNTNCTITVTGYRQYTDRTIGIWVLTSNPATFEDFQMATDPDSDSYSSKASLVANPPSNNTYELSGFGWGNSAPPDGTYTVVVSTSGIGFSLAYNQVYKFTNVTISGGSATVPFNEVVGSSVGSNGRLK